jgi:hypothetical protein
MYNKRKTSAEFDQFILLIIGLAFAVGVLIGFIFGRI